MKKFAGLLIVCVAITGLVFGQGMPDPAVPQGENLQVPEGWEIRLDKPNENLIVSSSPDSGDIYFVNMTPGWHLTTGPRAIYWHPENNAEGDFTISTSMYTFDTKGRDREAFGLFFGGSNLYEDNQEYFYFLIRNTGHYLVKARKGSETETLVEWTSSDSILRFTEETESSALNTLSVKVVGEKIHFLINEQEVSSFSKEGINTNGLFGFRVNHAINLHISDLSLN